MEQRERAAPPTAPAAVDAPKLAEVLAAVCRQVAPGDRPLAEAFARQLFDKAGAELLEADEIGALAGLALAGFRFVAERGVEEPRVRVFDPDLVDAGWQHPCTVIETLLSDRPFIVDTIREHLRHAGCTIQRFLHPIFAIERDPRGAVLAIAAPGASGRRCSFVHVEVERVADPGALAAQLTERLTDVVHATDDYAAMRGKLEAVIENLRRGTFTPPWNIDLDEIAAFLAWLGEKSFVFLGYREYQFAGQGAERTAAVRRGSSLGILRREERSSYFTAQPLPEVLRHSLNEPPLLIISKTDAESPIHRRAHMDYVGVKEVDSGGVVVGERRFLGLFTSKAYAEESASVPLLRRKLSAVLDAEGALEGSHDYKAIVTVFSSIPKAELLALPADLLRTEVQTTLAAESEDDVTVLHHVDALGRGVFVVVILPRARFSDELYRRIEARLVQAFAASAVFERHLTIDQSEQVRMHFYLAAPAQRIGTARSEELRASILHLLRTWDDRLRDALREHFPRERARVLADCYIAAFSHEYKAATDVAVAVGDIRCLEQMLATRKPQVDLSNDTPDDARFTAVKLYLAGQELVLSDFLPVLENLGMKVFAEDPLDVVLPEVGRVRIHTFFVQDAAGARLDLEHSGPSLTAALVLLYGGRIESDRLNALILQAELDWRQVDVLRTYVNHGVQIGSAPSRSALVHALCSWPNAARLLWEYFAAKFDPQLPTAPRERLARGLPEIEQRFLASLDAVTSIEDDRILRALFSAVAATVRTNFFRPSSETAGAATERSAGAAADAALAVKIESARIAHLPRPHPEYEIYVHAVNVEAIHLRGARVARGGIRLSDRPDDFRTEILDLMKTQTVKNAVIVPAGAKGGFIVKRRPGMPAADTSVVVAYRTFIGALIDLTDNIVRGRLVSAPGLLSYDEPDPYLVVAADKGTSSFSDIANEIAAQRQFWLGDAFASGGTHGYDHKKEGITARGAWECVRRHFREMGRDADRDSITVIGIGDMSGDVFGNGLLLSRRFCLNAAFNHQHIFLDPDPDPARSFAERERLFQLPRSSWTDYTSSLISAGGGVFPRSAKKVPLSAAVRRMLGLERDEATGEEVVRAILRMPADLLWNGGIGTYVKAGDETHAAVGDSANDSVRINAAELQVKVVAEGGNLGFTQRGRVEYALRGGRINTDAIDNSAGVDLSDHEVNLKIALAGAVESGQLPLAERNQLLTELTPDVTSRVLAHNQRQARALSLDQSRSQTRLNDFRELMTLLETDGILDRQLEGLPDRDTLRNRRGIFLGLTRPELAVLLAHSKLWLQKRLLGSALVDDVYFERPLRDYFPETVNVRFGQGVRSHRLRREIIAVELANAVVDTMGAAFVSRVVRDTGADAVAVARAWAVAAAVSGANELWAQISSCDPPAPPAAETRGSLTLAAAIEQAVKWILETQPADLPTADLRATLAPPIEELLGLLPNVVPPAAQATATAAADALAAEGLPRPLAQRLVPLGRLAELFEIAHLASELERSRRSTAEVYCRVGDLVDLDWIRQSLIEAATEDRWERRAIEGLREGLVYARRELTRNVLSSHAGDDGGLREYAEAHDQQLRAVRALIDDIKSARRPTLAALVVVMREIGRLVGRGD